VTDVKDLGLDRFDAEGNSRLKADPIALPFPSKTHHHKASSPADLIEERA
jgi:hypothetical protein